MLHGKVIPVAGACSVNTLLTTRLVELRKAQSRALLPMLWASLRRARYMVWGYWEPQTLLLQDNAPRSTAGSTVTKPRITHRKIQRIGSRATDRCEVPSPVRGQVGIN